MRASCVLTSAPGKSRTRLRLVRDKIVLLVEKGRGGDNVEDRMDQSSGSHSRTLRLIKLVNGGDREALNELLERYQLRIAGYVHTRLKGPLRGRLETMDIVQDVYEIACRQLPGFHPRSPSAFHHWLRKIAGLKLKDAYKFHLGADGRNVRKEVSFHTGEEDSINPAEHLSAPTDDPGKNLDRRAAFERILELMEALSEEQRQVIQLRIFEGLSLGEIAEQLGIEPDAARMRLVRALKKIKVVFEQGNLSDV